MYRTAVRLLSTATVLALTCSAAMAADAPKQTLRVPGLKQPVEILKDRWGISHIYAKNESDLFFAQGYNVARDRLFQLELWRRHQRVAMWYREADVAAAAAHTLALTPA